MQTVQTLLGILGILLGLVVIAASITAYYKVSVSQAQIKELRADRDDQQIRIERLKEALAAERLEREKVTTQYETLLKRYEQLEKVVTGREQLDHLQQQLDAHDQRVNILHSDLKQRLDLLEAHMRNDKRGP